MCLGSWRVCLGSVCRNPKLCTTNLHQDILWRHLIFARPDADPVKERRFRLEPSLRVPGAIGIQVQKMLKSVIPDACVPRKCFL